MDELFEKIFYRALTDKSTDIHLILRKDLKIYFRTLGKLLYYDSIENEIGNRFMNYLKYKASINTNYRLLPQTGSFHFMFINREYFLRVSFLPSLDFESIVIRILNNHEKLSIEELTPIKEITDFYFSIPQYTSGLILISGATGSGKTTTLYTLLDYLTFKEKKNVITIEDPIEVKKENCLQIELNENLGITYQATLKQILRHDPDIILIGEIRDEQTAKIAITCALTGHLVLTTIHASNAHLALKRLLNLGISELDVLDVMIASITQKIVYDTFNNKAIVLAELMKKNHILSYINDHCLNYHTMKEHTLSLIEKNILKKECVGDILNE